MQFEEVNLVQVMILFHWFWVLFLDRIPAHCIRVGTMFEQCQLLISSWNKGLMQWTCSNCKYNLVVSTATPKKYDLNLKLGTYFCSGQKIGDTENLVPLIFYGKCLTEKQSIVKIIAKKTSHSIILEGCKRSWYG